VIKSLVYAAHRAWYETERREAVIEEWTINAVIVGGEAVIMIARAPGILSAA
jgi:hypothetical protein